MRSMPWHPAVDKLRKNGERTGFLPCEDWQSLKLHISSMKVTYIQQYSSNKSLTTKSLSWFQKITIHLHPQKMIRNEYCSIPWRKSPTWPGSFFFKAQATSVAPCLRSTLSVVTSAVTSASKRKRAAGSAMDSQPATKSSPCCWLCFLGQG